MSDLYGLLRPPRLHPLGRAGCSDDTGGLDTSVSSAGGIDVAAVVDRGLVVVVCEALITTAESDKYAVFADAASPFDARVPPGTADAKSVGAAAVA